MKREYIEGLVSVITPIFNSERYITKTLESVFSQTYKKIEIVLVDDCSKDKSSTIIRELQKEHPEITYFLQKENQGAGVARNKALELARGQYVAFLDADDIWLPEKVEMQMNLMKEKKCPFSYTAIEMIDENDVIIKQKRALKETCNYNYLLHNTIIATSSVIIDRNVFGDFKMHLRRGGQDYATWLSLLRNGTIACGINKVFVKYRVTNNSLSSNKFKSIKQVWDIQTNDEKIPKICAMFNVCLFILNALKKYLI